MEGYYVQAKTRDGWSVCRVSNGSIVSTHHSEYAAHLAAKAKQRAEREAGEKVAAKVHFDFDEVDR